MLDYTVNGVPYQVNPEKLEQFLLEFPNAVAAGKTNGLAGDPTTSQTSTGLNLDGGSSEFLGAEKKTEISDILKKHKGSVWAEENIVPELRVALEGTDWGIEQAIRGVDAVTLTSEGGVAKTFNLYEGGKGGIGYGKEGITKLSDEMINFINENPIRSPEYVEQKQNFMDLSLIHI